MSNPAIAQEEVHLCARCKAIIESEHTQALKEDSGLHDLRKSASRESRVEDIVTPEIDPFKEPPSSAVVVAAAPAPISVAEIQPTKTVEVPIEPPTKTLAVPVEELRSAPRKKLEVNVGIQSDSHFFAGLSGDVSKGGLFVATYAEIPIGGKVVLDFELPNGPVVIEGTVRWHRLPNDNAGPGLGIQFEGVQREQLALIERFCQARPPLYYDQADDDF
jgi:uncharacterized protein (TIGR02266 family)